MGIATYGSTNVDWEARIDMDRLRTERLARLREHLERSEFGALLAFDFYNIRYMTATHIGTWGIDKMVRFALLMRGAEPIVWDFGSAAKHHQLYNPWLTDEDGTSRSRAGISTLRGAIHPGAGRAESVAEKVAEELRARGLENEPLGVDFIELPVHRALLAEGIDVQDGQQVFLEARRVKTHDEISLLTHACGLADMAYEELYRALKPGMKENETVGLVSKLLYDNGSEFVSGINAISGERCNPHPHLYSDRMMRPGDPAYFDIVHTYLGYQTCYYRTFAVGSASPAMRDAYKRAREIMDISLAAVKPGVTTADIVSLWPKAQDFGFDNEEAAFALQYGHGVGISVWEKPIFSRLTSIDNPEVIEEGNVFALETYWPAKDGWSAARIEEELVVTADGCEVITRFPAEELLVAGQRYFAATGPLPAVRESQSHLNTPEGRNGARS
ncbi:Xaa-Pro peptidase family protein [Saccharopolyspora sp. K220]|uniref:M24 family metallopeptidase n=1 Tax=Saccharopolyspora soli TaxID=2926618 RepID=UPI001F55BBC2|nr:Xaa-Pro peptidase family protein [Saccharopolyspora soli]MCI2422340.1 Xaa-Pro peptidase family protein [Saccharopolyspora soli]